MRIRNLIHFHKQGEKREEIPFINTKYNETQANKTKRVEGKIY